MVKVVGCWLFGGLGCGECGGGVIWVDCNVFEWFWCYLFESMIGFFMIEVWCGSLGDGEVGWGFYEFVFVQYFCVILMDVWRIE